LKGQARFRSHDRPLYDHTTSPLSKTPKEFALVNSKPDSNAA